MIRNLKVLGLALIAVFAMSAMVASAASAAEFTSSQATTTITGEETTPNELIVDGVGVTCSDVKFHAHVSAAAVSSVTVTPTYTECKTSVGTSATVTGFGHHGETNKCHFVLYAAGTADLVCPTGTTVTIDAPPCTVHIPAQKGLKTVAYTTGTTEGKHDLTVHVNITNIEATTTDGFLCPFNGSQTLNNATLKGTVTVWGEDPDTGAKVAITHDTP